MPKKAKIESKSKKMSMEAKIRKDMDVSDRRPESNLSERRNIKTRTATVLSVPRTKTLMRHLKATERINKNGPIFMTAAVEYIMAEIIDLAQQ